MKLHELTDRKWQIQPCSAKTEEGIQVSHSVHNLATQTVYSTTLRSITIILFSSVLTYKTSISYYP